MAKAMILYPAIDLKDGQAVRLYKGDFAQMTVFDTDPSARAASFEAMGFGYLHIVDLDGALKGAGANLEAIAAIRARTSLPMQVGGGIRDLNAIEKTLSMGVTRDLRHNCRETTPICARGRKGFSGPSCSGN
jgi:phosphoribosylformimino-5-aminoimidazole carboxamide ribotide isomerase